MKHTFRQIFRSPNFVIGFAIFMAILLTVIVYPLIIPDPPLEIIGQGTFFEPGIYVNVYDSIGAPHIHLNLDDAADEANCQQVERRRSSCHAGMACGSWGFLKMRSISQNTEKLLDQWASNYDPAKKIAGMTNAKRNYYIRLNTSLKGLLSIEGASIAEKTRKPASWKRQMLSCNTDYVNVSQVPNVRCVAAWEPITLAGMC